MLLEYFRDKHKEELGYPYMVSWGKDSAIMKSIGHTYGHKKAVDIMDRFFEQIKTDEFLKKTGASVGIFKTQIPKLLLLSNGKDRQGAGKW